MLELFGHYLNNQMRRAAKGRPPHTPALSPPLPPPNCIFICSMHVGRFLHFQTIKSGIKSNVPPPSTRRQAAHQPASPPHQMAVGRVRFFPPLSTVEAQPPHGRLGGGICYGICEKGFKKVWENIFLCTNVRDKTDCVKKRRKF